MTTLVVGWDGEVLHPLRQSLKTANGNLVSGERYIVEVAEVRSLNSHNFYFASLGEAFKNLPETVGDMFPTVEHLRKRALVETGWRIERQFIASSKAEALRLASWLRGVDEFAAIAVNGSAIIEWRAKSQSMHSMGKQDFERSKSDVLAWCAKLIGVSPKQLAKEDAKP